MPSITLAHSWAVDTCNADNIGYSQTYRNAQTVDGVTYYDCSSFIWYALKAGGFNVETAHGSSYPFVTGNMGATLLKLGFRLVTITDEWRAGDILLRSGHTEMAYSGRTLMGAHTSDADLVDQVSINSYTSSPSNWTNCYRYGGGTVEASEWIYGNYYLDDDEMQNNAIIVYKEMSARGWTLNAIAGLLGNMESESTINPALWQSLNEGNYSGGYGLVQWTPATNYTDWAVSNGFDIKDGYSQLKWIDEETVNTGQWIATTSYPISFHEFKTSIDSPEYLASAFLKNFERAGVEVEDERRSQARKWATFLEVYGKLEEQVRKVKKGYNFLLFKKGVRRV